MKVAVAKALKLRKRLAEQVAKVSLLAQTTNSAIEGTKPEFDVANLLRRREVLVGFLIEIKTAISVANQPIYDKIHTLAELKGYIAFLAGIDVKNGPVHERFASEGVVKYAAQVRSAEIQRLTTWAEKEIDRIQEELEVFNHKTEVEISDAIETTIGDTQSCAAAGESQ